MCASIVVKNTFLCVVGDEALSPPSATRRRACTTDVASLSASDSESTSLSASGHDPATPCSSTERLGASHTGDLLTALEAGGAEAASALAELRASITDFAFDAVGCFLVQRALKVGSASEGRYLAAGLRGWVRQAARSPYAHHVLQEVVHNLGTEDFAFIMEELRGQARAVALNVHGSTVVCRLLEYSASHAGTAALTDEVLLGDVPALCCHKFGHQVAMSVLSNGLPHQRRQLLAALRSDLQRFARHRFASRVLEEALLQCPADECHLLAAELMATPGTVQALACHGFGVQIVRAMMQLPSDSGKVLHYLRKASHRVAKDRYGAELVRELGLDSQ